jgi:Cu(I)/Ag(I) efflux system membrane fusion protein
VFAMREIGLGPMLGSSYVVTDGLKEGEEIVTRGAFSVDAAAQLEGKPSMMNQQKADQSSGQIEVSFLVSGNCEMCKERIEEAAMSVKGVSNAVWDIQLKRIRVTLNSRQADVDEIHKAIARAGHDTEKTRADDAVYDALPECCLYRSPGQK